MQPLPRKEGVAPPFLRHLGLPTLAEAAGAFGERCQERIPFPETVGQQDTDLPVLGNP